MENQEPRAYFSATVTLKNNIRVFSNIKEKLTTTQRKLFDTTCFSPWLKVQHPNGDPLLCHLILQSMTNDVPEGMVRHDEDMWFHFPPAYTRFGREEFCLVTGLRFGRIDSLSPYTRHIPTALWLERVFSDLPDGEKIKVVDLKRSFAKPDFTKMRDIDVIRVCLLLAVYVGFLGRQDNQPISKDFLLMAEDLDSWNKFPWGSYIWEFTRKQLLTAIDKRDVNQDGGKYTLVGFIWAFKIWILEAFPSMRSFTVKTSHDDIPRAITWKRKKQMNWYELLPHGTINDEANLPIQTLTPTKAEAATDWWQASRRFFDGTDDQDLQVFQERDGGSTHSPLRHQDSSPYRDNSPHPLNQSLRRPDQSPSRKKPHIHLSPRSPPLQDDVDKIPEEKIRELVKSLVSPLQEEVRVLQEKVSSLQKEVQVLRGQRPDDILHDDHYYSEPDEPSALGVRRGSRVRHLGAAYKSPYTALGRRLFMKKPNPCPIVQASQASHAPVNMPVQPQKKKTSNFDVSGGESPVKPQKKRKKSNCDVDKPPKKMPPSPPIVEAGDASHAHHLWKKKSNCDVVQPPVQPQMKKKSNYLSDKPPMVNAMLDPIWLSYELPTSTIPKGEILPTTIKDNSAWAKTAVDFYLHERGQGCYSDILKFGSKHMLLERSWWGTLLGVETNGYLEDFVRIKF